MEPYFFFFICALFIAAIIVSCVLRCRVLANRRRQRLRLQTQSQVDTATAGVYTNTDATNIAYYYGQQNYDGNSGTTLFYGQSPGSLQAGHGVYNGRQIPRQPGQAVLPATVLMSNTGGADPVGDNLVSQLFPQARVVEDGRTNNNSGQVGPSAPYVPPNSVFYDRDMHRDANGEEVYGVATYLPRPPMEDDTLQRCAGQASGAGEKSPAKDLTVGEVAATTAVPITVAAKLEMTKDECSDDSGSR